MSWSGYIDNLMATNHMTAVGIFGLDGSTWAASANYPLSLDGIKLIIASVNDSSKMAGGLTVGGERYILVRSDPGVSILLKKGASGVIAYKSTQSILIAVHDPSVKSEIVLTDIGKVVDYLSRHGY